MKKILALLLAVIMSVGILAACEGEPEGAKGGDDPVTTPTPGPSGEQKSERQLLAEQYGLPWTDEMESWQPISFTYFSRNPGQVPAADNPIIEIVSKITNVTIEFEMLVGDLGTKLGTMLTGGDVPDMIFVGGDAGIAIDSGKFMPIDDLIEEYAPRLRAHYDPWWDLMRYTDGRIYTAEIWSTPVGERYTFWDNATAFWIQKDVLDHFGYAPRTLDEYFDFLREYKELYPTIDGMPTVAFSILHDINGKRYSIDNGGFFLAGHANWGGAVNTDGSGPDAAISPDVHARWTSDFQYKWWKKLNEEFHKGTFSQETFTLSESDYVAQIANGVVLGVCDQQWVFEEGENTLIGDQRYNRTYLPVGIVYDDSITPAYLDDKSESFTGSNGINISNTISDPVRAIKYLDWIISEEVQKFLYWGIEGEHYFYNDEGRIERPPEQRELQLATRWTTDNLGRFLFNAMPKMQGTYPSDGNPTDTSQSYVEWYASLTSYDKEIYEKLGIETQIGLWGPIGQRPAFYPYWSITPPRNSDEEFVNNRIGDITKAQIALMIVADEDKFDDLWESFVADIHAVDVSGLEAYFASIAQTRIEATGG
ncbi:MAG: extracellular solute-binding protein [Oscillospiraceae bacterium]|nr:extracellular solute-binding protein [Oscillospiraceae bacterium]